MRISLSTVDRLITKAAVAETVAFPKHSSAHKYLRIKNVVDLTSFHTASEAHKQ